MFARIKCAGLFGVQGFFAETEADCGNGIPGFYLTGALSQETKEGQYRVSTAIKNSGIRQKPQKITVNISPAFRRKEGTAFDLSILMAVLCAQDLLPPEEYPLIADGFLNKYAFLGELGLDGGLKGVRGVLPMADMLKKSGMEGIVVPMENAGEAMLVPGLQVIGQRTVAGLLRFLRTGEREPYTKESSKSLHGEEGCVDFSDIRGQRYLKRAAEIAVSGRHNLLLSGAAGSGKTMIARRIPTIMPELTREEQIELSKIYSICGLLPPGEALVKKRPFRAPHHVSSAAALIGGGSCVRPGEVSLASKGVLFLDELPLYRRETIEALREPLEERRVLLTRLKGVYEFPADFALVAACNNCPCGFYPDTERCRCTKAQIRMYQGRLSRPILERIDICAEALPIRFEDLKDKAASECSAEIRKRVERVYGIQRMRFRNIPGRLYNSEMTAGETEQFCRLSSETETFLREVFIKMGFSARTFHKVLRVARTIADMEGMEEIETRHISEAAALRSFENRLWGGAGA
ncbi:MAG: YifB family Mg chelatase-like AAA ATPase [Eubacteriales bacterium]|nr:YifB family Mg chelatase-like AAA ATPase [Eubacteriales bacterium]